MALTSFLRSNIQPSSSISPIPRVLTDTTILRREQLRSRPVIHSFRWILPCQPSFFHALLYVLLPLLQNSLPIATVASCIAQVRVTAIPDDLLAFLNGIQVWHSYCLLTSSVRRFSEHTALWPLSHMILSIAHLNDSSSRRLVHKLASLARTAIFEAISSLLAIQGWLDGEAPILLHWFVDLQFLTKCLLLLGSLVELWLFSSEAVSWLDDGCLHAWTHTS